MEERIGREVNERFRRKREREWRNGVWRILLVSILGRTSCKAQK